MAYISKTSDAVTLKLALIKVSTSSLEVVQSLELDSSASKYVSERGKRRRRRRVDIPAAITVTAHVRVNDTVVGLASEVLQILGSHKSPNEFQFHNDAQIRFFQPVNGENRNGYSPCRRDESSPMFVQSQCNMDI